MSILKSQHKILALLLAIILFFGMMSVTAFAAPIGPENIKLEIDGKNVTATLSGVTVPDSMDINQQDSGSGQLEWQWAITFSDGEDIYSISSNHFNGIDEGQSTKAFDDLDHQLFNMKDGSFDHLAFATSANLANGSITWYFTFPDDVSMSQDAIKFVGSTTTSSIRDLQSKSYELEGSSWTYLGTDFLESYVTDDGGTQPEPTTPVITTSPGALTGGVVGTPYSAIIAASGDPTSFAVSSGSLPAGLNLATDTGVISGTPTTEGTSNFSITATNDGGISPAVEFSIAVNPKVPDVVTADAPTVDPDGGTITLDTNGVTTAYIQISLGTSVASPTDAKLKANKATVTVDGDAVTVDDNELTSDGNIKVTAVKTGTATIKIAFSEGDIQAGDTRYDAAITVNVAGSTPPQAPDPEPTNPPTPTPTPLRPSSNNDDDDDDRGSSGRGSDSNRGSSTTASGPSNVTTAAANSAVNSAIAAAQASGAGTATARLTNPGDISLATLQTMARQAGTTPLRKVDPATLAEASAICIDTTLPQMEKAEQYIKQIGNPYCFMSGDTPVQIRFVGAERALPKALQDYFSRLAQK